MASIDLKKAHLTRVHGDLLAVYSWINEERALFLIPKMRKKSSWYIVAESAAYKYDDPRYLATQCVKACDVLGIEPSQANWVRVATIINEGLPDLIQMPHSPDPEKSKANYGQVNISMDGQLIKQEDFRIENNGVEYGQI